MQEAQQQIFNIGNMDCANCAKELETGVAKLEGVKAVRVDFSTGRMILTGDVPMNTLTKRVEDLGKTILDDRASVSDDMPRRTGILGFWDYLLSRSDSRWALVGGALLIVGMVTSFLMMGFVMGLAHVDTLPATAPIVIVIYSSALLAALHPIARSGWKALRINHQFNINLLMTIAATGALLIGEYLEAATVIFLFSIAEALEGYTADRARDSLRQLLALKPTTADVVQQDMTINMPVESVRVDDTIRVLAGERIPLDGVILDGISGVNQAPITGESLPVIKQVNDTVFAGTINGNATLTIRVTHLTEDSTLSRIIHLVEEAQSQRAPIQRIVDTFAHYYTPAVVIIAFFVAILPPLLVQAPFYSTPDEQGWLYRALTMLVVACPCALVISTPVTVISTITRLARDGVLVKGGAYLEALATVKVIAFDKTGTLTEGNPRIQSIHTVGDVDEDMLLMWVAPVEAQSTHPLANAILYEAETRNLDYGTAIDVETKLGRGVTGTVDGHSIVIGSHHYFENLIAHDTTVCEAIRTHEMQDKTTLLVACDGQFVGWMTVMDAPREESASTIDTLKKQSLTPIMCTGDNATVAQAIAEQVHIDTVRANLLPQDKVIAIQDLRADYEHVAMVGDGINDTPALASATVGIALGGAASAQAMETADVVLMSDDLRTLPKAIDLSRFASRLIMQNVVLSIALKVVFLLLALAGGASLWMAVLADMGMSLAVTINGMRPLRRG